MWLAAKQLEYPVALQSHGQRSLEFNNGWKFEIEFTPFFQSYIATQRASTTPCQTVWSISGNPMKMGNPSSPSPPPPKKPRTHVWVLSWFPIGSAFLVHKNASWRPTATISCSSLSSSESDITKGGQQTRVWGGCLTLYSKNPQFFLLQADSNLTYKQQCKHQLHLTQNSGMGAPNLLVLQNMVVNIGCTGED